MTELQGAFSEIRDSMIANGFPAEGVDRLIKQAASGANEVISDFADRINDTPDHEWPNLYVVGMQMISILARHHAEIFKAKAGEFGLVAIKPNGGGHAPH